MFDISVPNLDKNGENDENTETDCDDYWSDFEGHYDQFDKFTPRKMSSRVRSGKRIGRNRNSQRVNTKAIKVARFDKYNESAESVESVESENEEIVGSVGSVDTVENEDDQFDDWDYMCMWEFYQLSGDIEDIEEI